MTKLRISDKLSLPIEFVTSTQAILAQKGKGKTHTATVEAEELLEAGQQVVIVDPTDAWWGLKSSPDGKSTGYSIPVFGGDHADLPLEVEIAEELADAIVTEHFSAIICTDSFSKGQELRFMWAFLERLYRKNRTAMHLFVDEADIFAPQKPFGGDEARVLGAMQNIVRRGRKKGIGCTLISQRAQVLNKDVLSQIDQLVAMGMNHPLDLDAIADWVKRHDTKKVGREMMESIPSLPRGDAWVWNPMLDMLKRVTIRDRHTFDSGATPKPGEKAKVAKVLAPVDLERLGRMIAETAVSAKANDPKALQARVRDLEKQLASKPGAKIETRVVEEPVVDKTCLAALLKGIDKLDMIRDRLAQAQQVVVSESATLRKFTQQSLGMIATNNGKQSTSPQTGRSTQQRGPVAARPKDSAPSAGYERRVTGVTAGETALPIGEAATLRALIQYPDGLERRQLTVLTGYKRSTRDAYIARLRERGCIDTDGDRVFATNLGASTLPDAEPLPTGKALQAWWFGRLPSGECDVLRILVDVYPEALRRDAIDESTGFRRSTRDAYLSRLAAKELVVDGARGEVRASRTLFDGDVRK